MFQEVFVYPKQEMLEELKENLQAKRMQVFDKNPRLKALLEKPKEDPIILTTEDRVT